MFDFFTNNLVEIIAILVSTAGGLMSVPITLKRLREMDEKSNKTRIELKEGRSFEFFLNNKKEAMQQDENISTPPSPKPPKYDFNLFSSKAVTLKELYEKRSFDKSLKKISFTLAVVMSIIGTIILFSGIIISLFANKEIGWITTSSGAIIEVIASIYFWLVNRTMKEVKDNSKQLEKTEDLFTAIELVEKISDTSIKDETYKNIIDNLMNREKTSK